MGMTDLSLTCKQVVKAPPERVFDAWLDPVQMSLFMSPRPEMHVRDVTTDARVGGRFFVLMVGDKDYPHEGSYRVIDRPKRLVFSWEAPWSAPGTEVEILFHPHLEGTEVVLTHVRFLSEDSRDNHLQGWSGILGKLAGLFG
jgi:uncharacterized protein YndB with AHSA1/START domain